MLAANGPGFTFPDGANFQPLPESFEPSGKEAAECALLACRQLDSSEGVKVGGREVVFAGLGEPLVRLPALLDALRALRGCDAVSATRLNTNGLVPADDADRIARELHDAGVASVCVQLQTASATQHVELVEPKNGLSLADACRFVTALVRVGIPVECTAVGHPDVDQEAVRELAVGSLGATSFKTRPYFP